MFGHTRPRWLAGACLLVLAGCTLPEYLSVNYWQGALPGDGLAGNAQYVAGSLDVVSRSTQNVLRELGIRTVVNQEGEQLVLHCTTKSGKRFALIMERWPAAEGMQTRIEFAWEGSSPDDAVRLQVLGALLALSTAPQN